MTDAKTILESLAKGSAATPALPEQRLHDIGTIQLRAIAGQIETLRAKHDRREAEARSLAARARRAPLQFGQCVWPRSQDRDPSAFKYSDGIAGVAIGQLSMAQSSRSISTDVLDAMVEWFDQFDEHRRERIMLDHEGEFLHALHGLEEWSDDALAIVDGVVGRLKSEYGNVQVGFYNVPFKGWRSMSRETHAGMMAHAFEAMKLLDVGMTACYPNRVEDDMADVVPLVPGWLMACAGKPLTPTLCPHASRVHGIESDAVSYVNRYWLPAMVPAMLNAESDIADRVAGFGLWYNVERLRFDDEETVASWLDAYWARLSSIAAHALEPTTDLSDIDSSFGESALAGLVDE